MINKMVKQLTGGKLLGEGTYGCVFFPSLECASKKEQKREFSGAVTKLFNRERHMLEEKLETKKVAEMDKEGKYTNRLLGSCETSVDKLPRSDTVLCKKIKPHTKRYYQLLYQHKGIDLEHFIRTKYELTDMFDYILNLMRGVQMLVKNDYVHLDIKPPNILITDTKKALLIDFGLGKEMKKLYNGDESGYLLEYSYPYYPPEFNLFFEMMYGDKIKENPKVFMKYYISHVLNNKYNNFNSTKQYIFNNPYFRTLLEGFTKEFIKNITKLNIRNGDDLSEYFYKTFAHKADVWSLGVVMYEVFINSSTEKTPRGVIMEFNQIIHGMMNPDPYKRYDIAKAISAMSKLMPNKTASPPIILEAHPINQDDEESVVIVSSIKNSIKRRKEMCMKQKLATLKPLITKHNMDLRYKRLNKPLLCEKLAELNMSIFKEAKAPQNPTASKEVATLIHNMKTPSPDKVDEKSIMRVDQCMKYFRLDQLKKLIDEKGLPKAWKTMNKEKLCQHIHTYVKLNEGNDKTVKRGRKKL